jgi:hypothetical protein
VSDASEESMNHGTREDKEEEDRYRTEHLVAVCRNMCMDIRVPLSTVVIVARLSGSDGLGIAMPYIPCNIRLL